MNPDSDMLPKVPLSEWVMVIFLRVVALGCLFFGVQYWAMLVGYSNHGSSRFDLLSFPWKVSATTLAVLYPAGAVGLWLRASWGPVIWVAIAGTELAMHEIWPQIFGPARLMTLFFVVVTLTYAALRFVLWRDRRRARNKNTPHLV